MGRPRLPCTTLSGSEDITKYFCCQISAQTEQGPKRQMKYSQSPPKAKSQKGKLSSDFCYYTLAKNPLLISNQAISSTICRVARVTLHHHAENNTVLYSAALFYVPTQQHGSRNSIYLQVIFKKKTHTYAFKDIQYNIHIVWTVVWNSVLYNTVPDRLLIIQIQKQVLDIAHP